MRRLVRWPLRTWRNLSACQRKVLTKLLLEHPSRPLRHHIPQRPLDRLLRARLAPEPDKKSRRLSWLQILRAHDFYAANHVYTLHRPTPQC